MSLAPQHLHFAAPDRADDRPQQQTAEVVGLAQVAGGAAGNRRSGEPVAVGQRRHEDLNQTDQTAGNPGDGERDAEGPKRILADAGALRRSAHRDDQHRTADGPGRGQRQETTAPPPKIEAPSAASNSSARAASNSSAAGLRGHAALGIAVPSTSRKPPQPTRAAAWLKNVADGATLNAIRVGNTTATAPHSANSRSRLRLPRAAPASAAGFGSRTTRRMA